ncbi:YccV-like-domain-containing protein [Cadophora sp. DSE1049]|nr:YccV-like-domain-containing protein [Cadophora sp. DSE1049]
MPPTSGSRDSGGKEPLVLTSLPDEVLQHILAYCPPHDVLLHVQRLSKRFNRLGSEPLLWRYHCRTEFKYWDSKHQIQKKFLQGVGDVDWKLLYTHRKKVDIETSGLLDNILERQTNRISKFKAISEFGYDAKDTLLRHCRTDDSAEDVLARRYYANSVLDHVHRTNALAEWERVVNGEKVPLERALGSFDLFVLHDQQGDLHEISEILDNLATQFCAEYSGFRQFSQRSTAIAAVAFLRSHNLTGLSSDIEYRDLQNNYIGIALQDRDHPSLPLISVAIFCALGQRLGLDARCCGIPSHAHAMVVPPEGQTLDGRELASGATPADPMFLDPYRSDEEVPLASLRVMLAEWGIPQQQVSGVLTDSTTADVVLRTSRNILATVQEFRAHATSTENTGHPTIRLHANPFADLDNAFYSALWAHFMFGNPTRRPGSTAQSQFIPLILERFERLYPMDASLIEKHVMPLYGNQIAGEPGELHEAVRVVRAADQTPKQLRRRNTPASKDGVKYNIGQVFRHRRYAYTAVITGWDIECGMDSNWIAHNNVDSLSRGRNQSFYHAFVEDTSIRYVAEENIEIIKPEVPISLMSLAGRYFKRWDKERRVFVSNVMDEYPDD